MKQNILYQQVRYLKIAFGLEPTLSEIFALRRYIVESPPIGHTSPESSPSFFEPVARLLYDYYGLDFLNLFLRDSRSKPTIPYVDKIISADDELGVRFSDEFKLYLRRIQSESYFPDKYH